MRVTAKGEYATRAVMHLARRYPHVVAIHEIAEQHRIPLKYLEQILLELKRGGILESRRGVHGGYTLARRPDQIFVGQVLQTIDGHFGETVSAREGSLLAGSAGSLAEDGCGLRQMWQDVQGVVEKILFSTSFEDILRRSDSRRADSAKFARQDA
jgi:Rrf2 family protein